MFFPMLDAKLENCGALGLPLITIYRKKPGGHSRLLSDPADSCVSTPVLSAAAIDTSMVITRITRSRWMSFGSADPATIRDITN